MLGATAALLFAPKPGKEFRNKLMNKTTLMGETVWERSNEIASMTKEKTALFSKGVVSKTKNLSLSDSVEEWGEEETNYISLTDRDTKKSSNGSIKEVDVRKKLEEAKKALEEEEKRIMQ